MTVPTVAEIPVPTIEETQAYLAAHEKAMRGEGWCGVDPFGWLGLAGDLELPSVLQRCVRQAAALGVDLFAPGPRERLVALLGVEFDPRERLATILGVEYDPERRRLQALASFSGPGDALARTEMEEITTCLGVTDQRRVLLAQHTTDRLRPLAVDPIDEPDVGWQRWSRARDRLASPPSLEYTVAMLLCELRYPKDVDSPSEPSPDAPAEENVFRMAGEFWIARFGGETRHLKDRTGIRYIGHLLANPHREFLASELALTVDRKLPAPDSRSGVAQEGSEGAVMDGRALGPVLDDRAREEYVARAKELREEVAEAERNSDAGRSASLRDELSMIEDQLVAASGLRGRRRPVGDLEEAARKSVRSAIGAALRVIQSENPALHAHLKAHLKTGTYCRYKPDPPVTWSI